MDVQMRGCANMQIDVRMCKIYLLGTITHPDIASLVDPLFACGGKRVTQGRLVFFTECLISNY
jgi:hypothetical protein